jgi:signal transduction histidine kinase/ActR/RegA family two-component response regulator
MKTVGWVGVQMNAKYKMHAVEEKYLNKWQKTIDIVAGLFNVPAALIMRVHSEKIEVLVSSRSEGNPYEAGEMADLNTGLYCETVMASQAQLMVSNALQDEDWKDNPDVALGMISYLGIPLIWPDGEIFGTICVLDEKTRHFSDFYQSLLWQFKEIIELNFVLSRLFHEELLESEKLLQTIFDNAPVAMLLVNENIEVMKMNQAGLIAADKPMDEAIGQRIGDILNCVGSFQTPGGCGFGEACQHCIVRRTVKETFATNQNSKKTEAVLRLKKQEKTIEYNVLVSTSLVNPKSTKTVLVSIDDISQHIIMEKRLRQSQKMEAIGTLAGGIAHDFNNILSPILGYAEILKDDGLTDSLSHEYLTEIFQAATRAKNLIKQILASSRQTDQKLMPVQLQPIIKETLRLLRPSMPTTIDIQQNIDPDCGFVLVDPTRFHQIIMNLATNAYHAMEESGGSLKIALKQILIETDSWDPPELSAGEYALLTVSDTGVGIEKHDMDKIFDPYFTTKENGKGTGLGLSIVQGIVNECNGDIRIYSEPGKGTDVRVYFPMMAQDIEKSVMDESRPVPGGTERILLVDDEAAIARMEESVLQRLGYRITIRTESVAALEAFKANPDDFDLIIADMAMPNLTGIQLAGEMKKIRPDIPVIIFTGCSAQINEERCKSLDIQGYAVKPLVKREIADTIRKVLDTSDAV